MMLLTRGSLVGFGLRSLVWIELTLDFCFRLGDLLITVGDYRPGVEAGLSTSESSEYWPLFGDVSMLGKVSSRSC